MLITINNCQNKKRNILGEMTAAVCHGYPIIFETTKGSTWLGEDPAKINEKYWQTNKKLLAPRKRYNSDMFYLVRYTYIGLGKLENGSFCYVVQFETT